MSSTISVRLTDEERAALVGYATTYDMSMSELLRSSALEMVEDAYDLTILERHPSPSPSCHAVLWPRRASNSASEAPGQHFPNVGPRGH
jgi:hypothetical protein